MEVVAGPAEATAMGNVAAQALALGQLTSLQEARRRIAQSADLATFLPTKEQAWETAAERFAQFRSD